MQCIINDTISYHTLLTIFDQMNQKRQYLIKPTNIKWLYHRFKAITLVVYTLFIRDMNNWWNSHKTCYRVRFRGLKYSTRNFAGKTLLWERLYDYFQKYTSKWYDVSFAWSYSNKSIQRWNPQWFEITYNSGIFRSIWNMYDTAKSRQSQLSLDLSYRIIARINW